MVNQSELLSFFQSLIPLCRNTGKNTSPSFGDEFSFITPSMSDDNADSYSFLCLDIGGTRCKACIKIKMPGQEPEWSEILDTDNKDLNTGEAGKGLELMSRELARRIKLSLSEQNQTDIFDGIAIVWSNKLQNYQLTSDIRGIGARVYGSKDGQAYRKGEWWNTDIEDGDDIAALFISGFRAAGINFKSLVINNDTVFTAKALRSASAGVVASTGANTTIIAENEKQFYNSECGGKITIPADLLGLKKLPAILPVSNMEIKIEDVCAGKGLPEVFHLLLNDRLLDKPLNAPEMARMLESGTMPEFHDILKSLIRTAGSFCALLLFISVANQLAEDRELVIALDSSQARFVPGYKEALDQQLAFLNSALGSKVSYKLMQPIGKISVPLQGAANTLEDFVLSSDCT